MISAGIDAEGKEIRMYTCACMRIYMPAERLNCSMQTNVKDFRSSISEARKISRDSGVGCEADQPGMGVKT